ncbi:MAG TPA: hypothetical protein VLV76_20985 [Candidatus Acidoferrum sp.]|nr:hypothetical protein [Candidatus Acidoferrum sp.]
MAEIPALMAMAERQINPSFWRSILFSMPAMMLTATLLYSREHSSFILFALWMGVMGYLWAGGIILERMIKRELRLIRLRKDF